MSPVERRALILTRLQHEGKLNLNECAAELGVSSMTIRRDLRLLVDQGVATISSGTAHLLSSAGKPILGDADNIEFHAAQKRAIAMAAAEHVNDGDTIIVDCGTTPLQMLRHIQGKHLTIITNSIPVASLVGTNPNVRLIYAPGEFAADSQGMVGPLTEKFFRTVRADKAFLGAHGFDARSGVHEPVLGDATAKCAMLACSDQSFLLADSSKYGNVHFMAMSKLSDFSCLITDDSFPLEKRPELEAACNQVIYA